MADQLRQSVFSRPAGYEDVNDAERLSQYPTFHLIGFEKIRKRGAALTKRPQVRRRNTENLLMLHLRVIASDHDQCQCLEQRNRVWPVNQMNDQTTLNPREGTEREKIVAQKSGLSRRTNS